MCVFDALLGKYIGGVLPFFFGLIDHVNFRHKQVILVVLSLKKGNDGFLMHTLCYIEDCIDDVFGGRDQWEGVRWLV